MSGIFLLTCVLLVFPSSAADLSPVSSTRRPPSGDEQLKEDVEEIKETLRHLQRSSQTHKCDEGLGAIVAQQAAELSSVNAKWSSVNAKWSSVTAKQQVMEFQLQAAREEMQTTKAELQSTKTELQTTNGELQRTKTELQSTKTDLENKLTAVNGSVSDKNQGSTFIRWGRKTCPSKTTLVYSGVAGGKQHNQKGSGTNPLCLTRTPQFDSVATPRYYGYIYGAEYENTGSHLDHDVPCSVCRAPQSTTIMVPATLTCPPGWTTRYTGHLTSQYKDHYATEYVCLDGSPEDDSSGARDDNGLLFYYVTAQCGSLPCPPYIQGKVVTCVVCSK